MDRTGRKVGRKGKGGREKGGKGEGFSPRRSIQRVFITRDVFSDDGDEVVSCLEGESGLQACYSCTLGEGEMLLLWGLRNEGLGW